MKSLPDKITANSRFDFELKRTWALILKSEHE
jgi:hypothetical protein